MWRLLASVLVVSDTGGVSMTLTHTDWPTEVVCKEMIETMYRAPESAVIGGHKLAIKTTASCVPVGGSYAAPRVEIVPPGISFGWGGVESIPRRGGYYDRR
jgi:hypothetical protein